MRYLKTFFVLTLLVSLCAPALAAVTPEPPAPPALPKELPSLPQPKTAASPTGTPSTGASSSSGGGGGGGCLLAPQSGFTFDLPLLAAGAVLPLLIRLRRRK